jgi:hypothetical protein
MPGSSSSPHALPSRRRAQSHSLHSFRISCNYPNVRGLARSDEHDEKTSHRSLIFLFSRARIIPCMRYALPALALVALEVAEASSESRNPSRTVVPAIELRADLRPEAKPESVNRLKQAKKQPHQKATRSSARARFSSGRGGAGAAPAPPSPPLRAGRADRHRDDDRDH